MSTDLSVRFSRQSGSSLLAAPQCVGPTAKTVKHTISLDFEFKFNQKSILSNNLHKFANYLVKIPNSIIFEGESNRITPENISLVCGALVDFFEINKKITSFQLIEKSQLLAQQQEARDRLKKAYGQTGIMVHWTYLPVRFATPSPLTELAARPIAIPFSRKIQYICSLKSGFKLNFPTNQIPNLFSSNFPKFVNHLIEIPHAIIFEGASNRFTSENISLVCGALGELFRVRQFVQKNLNTLLVPVNSPSKVAAAFESQTRVLIAKRQEAEKALKKAYARTGIMVRWSS